MAKIIAQPITVVAKKMVRQSASASPVVELTDETIATIEEVLSETLGVIVEIDPEGLGEPEELADV